MMRYSVPLVAALTLAGLAFMGHGCTPAWAHPWADCTGEGPLTTQNRAVSDFASITVAGPIDVQLTRGSTASLRLEAPKDVLPALETKVEQGRLILDTRGCVNSSPQKPIRAFVTFRQLGEIDVRGSGDVTVKSPIQGERFTLNIHGSGDVSATVAVRHFELEIRGSGGVNLAGQAGREEIVVAGSGDVDTSRLKASSVRVRISGSGDVDVYATDELDAEVNGSGDVVYRGNPKKVHRRVRGSGAVEAR